MTIMDTIRRAVEFRAQVEASKAQRRRDKARRRRAMTHEGRAEHAAELAGERECCKAPKRH